MKATGLTTEPFLNNMNMYQSSLILLSGFVFCVLYVGVFLWIAQIVAAKQIRYHLIWRNWGAVLVTTGLIYWANPWCLVL